MAYNPKEQWHPRFEELQKLLKKPCDIDLIKQNLIYLHSQLHCGEVYDLSENTYYDEIAQDICAENFAICPRKTNMTIAWDLWHITRIEDITTSLLLCMDNQVFDDYKDQLGTAVTDTGNAMTDDEVFAISNELNLEKLLQYRKAVGNKTRSFIEYLNLVDLSRTFPQEDMLRIKDEGGVIPQTEGLMYYWGNKTVSGLITMPMTKHQIMHLNDCRKIADWYNDKKHKL